MFAPTSFWTQALPADAPIDPSSAAYVAALVAFGNGHSYDLNFDDWSCGVFIAGPNTPLQKVTLDQVAEGESIDMQTMFNAVPVPANARPPGPFSGDNHVEIYSPSLDTLWMFWKFSQFEVDGPHTVEGVSAEVLNAPGYHAKFGGAIQNVSQNVQGSFIKEVSFPGTTHGKFGTTASGLPCLPGLIRVGEAQRAASGVIDAIRHPLLMSGANKAATSNQFRWPALKTDGESVSATAVQEGMWFRLPASLSISGVADPFMRAICWTLQNFGAIDNLVGGSVAFKCETQATQVGTQSYRTDAWKGPEAKYGGAGAILTHKPSVLMAEVPWSELKLLDASYRPSTVAPGVML